MGLFKKQTRVQSYQHGGKNKSHSIGVLFCGLLSGGIYEVVKERNRERELKRLRWLVVDKGKEVEVSVSVSVYRRENCSGDV